MRSDGIRTADDCTKSLIIRLTDARPELEGVVFCLIPGQGWQDQQLEKCRSAVPKTVNLQTKLCRWMEQKSTWQALPREVASDRK